MLNKIPFFVPCYLVTDGLFYILVVNVAICFFVSGAAMILAALAIEAGLPDGVLNIVHGTHVSFSSLKLF